jgi:hypothetical protein
MAPARLLTFSAERPVEPGRYGREGFEPSFTIDVPDGWFAVQDAPGFFDLERDVGTLDVIAVQFARPSDLTSAATAADMIRARDGLVVDGPTAIEVGGVPGCASSSMPPIPRLRLSVSSRSSRSPSG